MRDVPSAARDSDAGLMTMRSRSPGCEHANGLAAADVAEAVAGGELERVFAGEEVDADVFASLHLRIGGGELLADARCRERIGR